MIKHNYENSVKIYFSILIKFLATQKPRKHLNSKKIIL